METAHSASAREAGENFGQRMQRLRRERGLPMQVGGGRKPLSEKYRKQIAATERRFAEAMAGEADRYVAELAPEEPEECPVHHRRLACPEVRCTVESARVPYNHRAAQYVFDRVMGRPSQRTEQTITITIVEQLTAALVGAFQEVNALDDAAARQTAFAARCDELGAQWRGDGTA